MATIYLSLGSNYQRENKIKSALELLHKLFGEMECSQIVRSSAVDNLGEDYFNLVVRAHTSLVLPELRLQLREIENQLGRDRNDKTKVSIDIDLLMYDDLVGDFETFVLPHPDIQHYRHVLQPLASLAPDKKHPLIQKSFIDLLNDMPGELQEARLWAANDF